MRPNISPHQPKHPNISKRKKHKGVGANPITDPLSRKDFRREVRASTRIQTRPLQRQLQAEKQGSYLRQTQQLPAYFQDYQAKLQASAQNTQAAYNQAGDRWANYLDTANATDQAARDKVNQGAQADAALRGANVSTLAADQAANASARRTDLGAVGGATIANQGANAYAYLQDKSRIGAREQVDQQLQEALRGQGINADLRELAQKKGEIKNLARQDLRKSERDYKIQQQAFSTPTANQRLSSRTSARNSAASTAQSGINAQLSQQGQWGRQKQGQRWDLKHPGSSGGLTASQKKTQRQTFKNAYAVVLSNYQSAETKPSTPEQWQQLASATVNGVQDSNGNQVVKGLGGSNPHLWTQKAIKRLKKRLKKQAKHGPPDFAGF